LWWGCWASCCITGDLMRIAYLTYEQIGQLSKFLDAEDNETMYLAVNMGFWGGLRLSELHSLGPANINLDTGAVQLLYTKNDKPREVFFPAPLCERIKFYVKHNRGDVEKWAADFDRAAALKLASLEKDAQRRGKPRPWVHRFLMEYLQEINSPLFGVKYQAIQKNIRRLPGRAGLADGAGFPLEISPHTFRHSLARYWLEQGGDLGKLSDYLGHSSIAITNDVYGRFNKRVILDTAKSLFKPL